MPKEKFIPLNAAFGHYTEHRAEATRLPTQTAPSQCPNQPMTLDVTGREFPLAMGGVRR